MPHVTINDLARELSLSPSTVSRALRNHPDIREETKRRVMAAAAAANYHPNLIAQSLQNRRSNIIGVVVPEIRNTFFSTVISGIEEVAYEAGYTIMVCQSGERFEREQMNIRALVANRVAGLLVSVSMGTHDSNHLRQVIDQSIPLVLFDRIVEGLGVSTVSVDDFAGAYGAVKHLLERGRSRIAHLGANETLSVSRQRRDGYIAALQDHGLPVLPELILPVGYREEDGRKGALQLLQLKRPVDGIFCINDPVALGAFCHLQDEGIRIPEELGIVGFSNNPNTTLVRPRMTTVNQPAFEMGRRSATLLLEQLAKKTPEIIPENIVLNTSLIVRESS